MDKVIVTATHISPENFIDSIKLVVNRAIRTVQNHIKHIQNPSNLSVKISPKYTKIIFPTETMKKKMKKLMPMLIDVSELDRKYSEKAINDKDIVIPKLPNTVSFFRPTFSIMKSIIKVDSNCVRPLIKVKILATSLDANFS